MNKFETMFFKKLRKTLGFKANGVADNLGTVLANADIRIRRLTEENKMLLKKSKSKRNEVAR